jgi:hypothetical protein
MASRKGIDGKREIFSFQDIYLLTKILGSLIVVPSKHMASYKRVIADLDLLFLKHIIPESNGDI